MYVARRNALRGIPGLDARLAGSIGALARDRFSAIEDWHEVGAHGEPDFKRYPGSTGPPDYEPGGQITWGSGSDYAPVSFFRDTAGMVHLRGAAQRWGGWNRASYPGYDDPEIAFRLPPGYRPRETHYFDSVGVGEQPNPDGHPFEVTVTSSLVTGKAGAVSIRILHSPGTVWLDGIMFPADPAEIPPNVVPG